VKWRIKIVSWIKGQLVGCDQFGNRYYQERPFLSLGWLLSKNKGSHQLRRWVVYKGMAEPTKVPPQWHGWLHGTETHPPQSNDPLYSWQKPPLPNLTGTSHAYHPKESGQEDPKAKGYEPWSPPSQK
jgi:NADH:ubiquinone oxidoreductase subunit